MEEIKIGQQRVFVQQLSTEEMEHSKQQHVLISMLKQQVDTSITQIDHDSLGKPFLADFPSVSISISHSADWIAFAISKYGEIGIDLEIENPKIKQAAIHFLNIHEQSYFPSPNLMTLHLIWGAKEAIYKYFGGTIDSLQNDITILKINLEKKQIIVKVYDHNYLCNFRILNEKIYLVICANDVPSQ